MLEPYNERAINAWLRNLRSGNWPQTRGSLFRVAPRDDADLGIKHVGYCCLGVACQVHLMETMHLPRPYGVKLGWEMNPEFGKMKYFGGGPDSSANYMPKEVREWYGFVSDADYFFVQEGLTEANDKLQMSFAAIADLIDAYVNVGWCHVGRVRYGSQGVPF